MKSAVIVRKLLVKTSGEPAYGFRYLLNVVYDNIGSGKLLRTAVAVAAANGMQTVLRGSFNIMEAVSDDDELPLML